MTAVRPVPLDGVMVMWLSTGEKSHGASSFVSTVINEVYVLSSSSVITSGVTLIACSVFTIIDSGTDNVGVGVVAFPVPVKRVSACPKSVNVGLRNNGK